MIYYLLYIFFFQAEDGIRDYKVTGVQTCALPILSIDPVDDCTFWYTNEYLTTNGSFNWKTRIASLKFTSCGPPGSPSATTLISSLNPSALGQAVTFTATVTSSATGTPTGTVTFQDGASALGTGTLSGGTATFTTSGLTAGTHSRTAIYGERESKRLNSRHPARSHAAFR